ncbi:MAG TPA: DUF6077 domain-containing protein, partial [Solirubrobacteraceae bacterium]
AVWAAVAWAVVLGGCAWVAWRARPRAAEPHPQAPTGPSHHSPAPAALGRRRRRARLLLAANLALAALTAALFAFTTVSWYLIWIPWLAAAACALAWCQLRGEPAAPEPRRPRLEPVVVAAWALGLAALSLFILNPDSDDAQYVHLSTWTAAHGSFPLRDVMFTDQGLPALFYPPASSYESLIGTLARIGPLGVPDIVYFVVPPLAAILSVLATWRLLRGWSVPRAWLALSVACAFLLFSATTTRAFGVFGLTRGWQGKSLLVAALVPLLLALAIEYGQRPTRRALVLLACAGVASIGLSTTAIFLVPVIALGCMAPVALRSVRTAVAGFAAMAGYPLAVGVASLAVGGRAPDKHYSAEQLQPQTLLHLVLGVNLPALLAVAAILVAPALLPRARAGAMLAGTALVAGCLLAPRLAEKLFTGIGLGRELSRLVWAVPVAALLGALATTLTADRHRVVRYAPAVVLIAAVVLGGQPVWSTAVGSAVPGTVVWKRWPASIPEARAIIAQTRPGDVILAPRTVSETLLVMSGEVTPVGTRPQYVKALRKVPGGHARERLRLIYLVDRTGRTPARSSPKHAAQVRRVRRALRAVGVDLACTYPGKGRQRAVLTDAGFTQPVPVPGLACLRAPGRG